MCSTPVHSWPSNILNSALIILVVILALNGCHSEKPRDTLDLYEEQNRVASGNYVDAHVESMQAACLSSDSENAEIGQFQPKILNVHFHPDSYIITPRTPYENKHGQFQGNFLTRRAERANAFLFWDHHIRKVGHYTNGASAYRTNLHVCMISNSSQDIIKLLFAVSPPQTAKFNSHGDYHTKDEAYKLASEWLAWRVADGPKPEMSGRMAIKVWKPCEDTQSQYDDWLQRGESQRSSPFKYSCSH